MFKKIITYFIILAVVLPIFATVVPFGGGVKTAYAAGDGNQMVDPCDFFGFGESMLRSLYKVVPLGDDYVNFLDKTGITSPPSASVWNCVTYTVAHFLYGVVMRGAIIVAGWASSLFNLSIQFSLTGDVFDANKNIMIRDGWAMVRDLFNLVFIFILLYAAISTILQYGNMDIKKILPGLIVAALLVNFSLMISKVVIDASHVFSWEFYNQIDATDGGKYPELENDINVNGDFQKKNLANVFLAGFNPQSVLTGKINEVKSIGKEGAEIVTETNDESQWQKVVAHALKNDEKFPSTIGRMILIILLETALALFSAFILFAGAIMFIFRIVLLWMVMIFSPVAFLGMILPGMGKYSKMWWDYLINQAFFPPAFLFMFMLSTKFINSKMIYGLLNIPPNGNMSMATGLDNGGITSVLLHFTIAAILMGGSLYIAKQMGGKSAELGMAWAHKGKNLALGGANKMMWRPLLRNTVGSISSGMAKSGWTERMAAKSPTFGGWMKGVLGKGGDVGGFDKIMEQRIKTGQGLSTPALRAQYFKNLTAREQAEWYSKASARTRVDLEDMAVAGGTKYKDMVKNIKNLHNRLSLEEQEKTIKTRAEVDQKKTDNQLADIFLNRSEEIQKEILSQMKDERKAGFINTLHARKGTTAGFATAVVATTATGKNIRKYRPDLAGSVVNIKNSVKEHKPEDLKHLSDTIVDPTNISSISVTQGMVENYNGGHAMKLIDRGDALTEAFSDKLIAIAGGSNHVVDIAPALDGIGNHSLANWLRANKIGAGQLGLIPL